MRISNFIKGGVHINEVRLPSHLKCYDASTRRLRQVGLWNPQSRVRTKK